MKKNIINNISYHAVYDKSIIEALQYAKENGFSGVQIAVEVPHLSFEKLSEEQIKEIRKMVTENNLKISIHCPDEGLSLFECSNYLRKGIFEYFEGLFNFAHKVAAEIITVHIGKITTYSTDTIPEIKFPEEDLNLYEDIFKDNLNKILEINKERFTICVENYNLDNFTLSLLQPYLDNDQLYLCWDLAKTFNREGKKNIQIEEYFIRNIDKVKQIHLHDLNCMGRSHRVIGTGKIDFISYIYLLGGKEIMDYCIEVRPKEMAKKSLECLKLLLDN